MTSNTMSVPACGAGIDTARPAASRNGPSALVRIADALLSWAERERQRRHLNGLDDHMLRDIGLTRADVDGEVSKWPWQA